jgi:N-methylhydantoinase A
MSLRVGVDIGGTFTDFAAVGDDGRLTVVKEPSTHHAPMTALERGLRRLAGAVGADDVPSLLVRTDLVVQGTTVALNALLEGTGMPTGLLVTRGFRDSLEIRLGHKDRRYDFRSPPPSVLVPRALRREVTERVDKRGQIRVALDEDEVRRHVRDFKAAGVTSIAISYLWSFLNPSHEERTREIIREEDPEAFVSLSSRVWPQIREYDRTSTTVLNAYVGPLVCDYVEAVERLLREHGYSGPVRYVHSTGGLASGDILRERPVIALNSGPAAGPAAGTHLGGQLERSDVLVMDMGGTSFDVTLVKDGVGVTVKNADFHGHRVAMPMIDLHTIGAGGGSIAWVDDSGILNVGPRSAGAFPGPAAYGRGGTAATVTDASVVLGYLGDIRADEGDIAIDREAAREAIRRHVAEPLRISVEEAAAGVHEVANHQMADAISVVSIERGEDPRDLAAVVGGGAGPIHAVALADKLDIPTVMVPRFAGTLCAFGAAVAPIRVDLGLSYLRRWEAIDAAELGIAVSGLMRRVRAELGRAGVPEGHEDVRCGFGVRYVGQIHEIHVAGDGAQVSRAALDGIAERFHEQHARMYGYADRGAPIELIDVDVVGVGTEAAVTQSPEPRVTGNGGHESRRTIWLDGPRDVPVYRGAALADGFTATGPCLVEETTTTIVIHPAWQLELQGDVYRLSSSGR